MDKVSDDERENEHLYKAPHGAGPASMHFDEPSLNNTIDYDQLAGQNQALQKAPTSSAQSQAGGGGLRNLSSSRLDVHTTL